MQCKRQKICYRNKRKKRRNRRKRRRRQRRKEMMQKPKDITINLKLTKNLMLKKRKKKLKKLPQRNKPSSKRRSLLLHQLLVVKVQEVLRSQKKTNTRRLVLTLTKNRGIKSRNKLSEISKKIRRKLKRRESRTLRKLLIEVKLIKLP